MNWNHVKTFLIVMLLVAISFLAVMLFWPNHTVRYDETALQNIEDLLARSDLSVDQSLLTKETQALPVYRLKQDDTYRRTLAEQLFGAQTYITFLTPDGIRFDAADGSVLLCGDDFSLSYRVGSPAVSASDTTSEDENVTQQLTDWLTPSAVGDHTPWRLTMTVQTEGDTVTVVCEQSLDGTALLGHTLTAVFCENTLRSLDGTWCFLPIEETFSAQLFDAVNILFIEKEALDAEKNEGTPVVKRTVDTMELAYTVYGQSDAALYLMPTWCIRYRSGEIATHIAVMETIS